MQATVRACQRADPVGSRTRNRAAAHEIDHALEIIDIVLEIERVVRSDRDHGVAGLRER